MTDVEIKLGTTATYSGPVSAIASYGEAQVAYFKMLTGDPAAAKTFMDHALKEAAIKNRWTGP